MLLIHSQCSEVPSMPRSPRIHETRERDVAGWKRFSRSVGSHRPRGTCRIPAASLPLDEQFHNPCSPWPSTPSCKSIVGDSGEVSVHQMAYHFTLLHFWEDTYPIASHRFALLGNDAHQMATVNVT